MPTTAAPYVFIEVMGEATLENWWRSFPSLALFMQPYHTIVYKQQDTNGTKYLYRRKFTPYLVRMSNPLTSYVFFMLGINARIDRFLLLFVFMVVACQKSAEIYKTAKNRSLCVCIQNTVEKYGNFFSH